MNFNKNLYYCCECKIIISSIEKLLFVEEKSSKGFCTESCIEDFYQPLIKYFENCEKLSRKRLNLELEDCQKSLPDKELVDTVLEAPDEIWKASNELGEEIFTYIKRLNNSYGIIICKVYEEAASFVLLATQTNSFLLLSEIRFGEKIMSVNYAKSEDSNEEISQGESLELTEDDYIFMQLLENKKSKLLADLLIKRKDNDISFEEFSNFEPFFSETLENPDEVFESKDNEGDLFFNYIKSIFLNNNNFYYIISCLKRKESTETNEVSVFPVLAFPTNDIELYSHFRVGKKISGLLQN
jgi:hypothetical protein